MARRNYEVELIKLYGEKGVQPLIEGYVTKRVVTKNIKYK